MKKLVSGIMLTLLITSMLTLAFNIQPVKAYSEGTTYEEFGPRADKLLIKLYPTETAEWDALARGEIDITDWPLSKSYYELFNSNAINPATGLPYTETINTFSFPQFEFYILDINNNNNPYLGNPPDPAYPNPVYPNPTSVKEMRQAIAYLTDRNQLTAIIGEGFYTSLYTVVPPSMGEYAHPEIRPGGLLEHLTYPYSRAAAATKLDVGGFPVNPSTGWRFWDRNGDDAEEPDEYLELKFVIRNDSGYRLAFGNFLADELNAVNVRVSRIYCTLFQMHTLVMADKDFHLYTGGWAIGISISDHLLLWNWDYYWHPGESDNYAGINNPDFNTYSSNAIHAGTFDEAKTNAWLAQEVFASEALSVPLWSEVGSEAMSKVYTGGNKWTPVDPDDGENVYRGGYWDGTVNTQGKGIDNSFTFLNMHPQGFERGGTIRWGFKSTQIYRLNPIYAEWLWDWNVLDQIYETLSVRNPYSQSERNPCLVQDFDVGTYDNPVYGECSKIRITLRSEATWADGEPITVADVYFSFVELPNMLKARGFQPPWWFPSIGSLSDFKIFDPYNFEVLLNMTSLVGAHALTQIIVLPKHVWKPIVEAGDPTAFCPDPNMVGSGPWRFAEYVQGSHVLLVANKPGSVVKTNLPGSRAIASPEGYVRYSPVSIDAFTSVINRFTPAEANFNTTIRNSLPESVTINYVIKHKWPNGSITVLDSNSAVVIPGLNTSARSLPSSGSVYGTHERIVEVTITEPQWAATTIDATEPYWVTEREDLNLDIFVNVQDCVIAGKAFGSYPGHVRWNGAADVNDDYKIDGKDVNLIQKRASALDWRAPEPRPGPVSLTVTPSSTIVTANTNFTVNVTVNNVVNLRGYQFTLFYDSTILDLTKAEPNWISPWYGVNQINDNYNSTHGKYTQASFTVGSSSPPSFNGTATLVTLTFWSVQDGFACFNLTDTLLVDSDAEQIPHVHEPWTLTLADSFCLPLDGLWTVSQRFGRWNPEWQGYHLGEDVLRSYEAPVYSPANGVVKHNAKRTGYGYVVIIEHELLDGTFVCSVLGHLREAGRISVGARVTKGQIVGYLSSVPEENGGIIHLHFGIRKGMYSEELDFDEKWRYRGYGPAAIVDYWHPPSQFIDYYNIQKTPTLPEEEGLRVAITSDKTFYELDETINFNVTVTNPTNETGINIVAHNSSLIIEPPAEIELEDPQAFHDLGDINPGESKTLSFTAIAKKAGALLKTWAKAAGEDLQLGLSMAGACLKKLFIGSTIPTEWSFAVITDPHIGRPECPGQVKGYLQEAVDAINALRADGYNITFVLVLGDITDGGEVDDFFEARSILNRLNDPNQDGDTSDGIPYVPLIGNHDVKSDTEWCFDMVFWGASNWDNRQLIEGNLTDFERQDGGELYYQNYYFSYEGLDFLCLDVAGRGVSDRGQSWTQSYQGQTRQWVQNYFDLNKWENFVLASHWPLYEFGGFLSQKDLEEDISSYNCNVTDFAGHTHRNYDTLWSDQFRVVETEAVCEVEYDVPWDFPKPQKTGNTLRIVKVENGDIMDYSIPKNPKTILEEHRIFWQHIACIGVEGFGSYLQPNKPAIFTAFYPLHHGFEISFQWTFGDGDSGSGITASHSYQQEGDYSVTLNITRRNLITNETTAEVVCRSLCVRTKHTIHSLPPNTYAVSFPWAIDLTEVPTNMHCQVAFGKNSSSGGHPVVVIGVHFEDADADIDFSDLVLDTNTATRKSVASSPSWSTEVDYYKWLFIPSSGAGSVYICLNATSLNDVTLENADFVVNDGETLNNMTVTTTYYEGKEYYLVYGNVTGFGGGEIFHDVAITNVTLSKTIVGQGYHLQGNVTIYDQGTFDENINLTLYVNTATIAVFHNVTLSSWDSATLTFTWNTTGFAYGNYTISAYAVPVLGETDTMDNNSTGGWVTVTILGDVNGDFKCDGKDIAIIAKAYGSLVGQAGYVPNADINGDGKIDGKDIAVAAKYYGTRYP
jgi:ABC-type transport system substrate-binding protein/murein DD-endopeptidase MepM/ murein hydrolase activator NlpD